MRTLYLIRHGTVHNPNNVAYRRLPGFVLGEQGKAEAERTAEFLKGEPIEVIYHSPLERAVETAVIVDRRHAVHLVVDERINEWDVDEDGETVAARMAAFWRDWLAGPNQVAAAVSHRDPIRALLFAIEGRRNWAEMDDLTVYPLPQAGVYALRVDEAGTRIEKVYFP